MLLKQIDKEEISKALKNSSIHKLTYKIDPSADTKGTIYEGLNQQTLKL
jgi:hypothetical protein